MKPTLRPTVWRTVRALANANRLRFLRLVFESKGKKNVSQLSEEIGLSVSTASTYLRALNARGLISVRKSDGYVLYGDGKNRSLPEAQLLQRAFMMLFSDPGIPEDWAEIHAGLLQAYAHPNRLAIIATLMRFHAAGFMEIRDELGLPKATVYRHLSILHRSSVIAMDGEGRYVLNDSDSMLEKVLRKLASEERESSSGFCKKRNCLTNS